MASYRKRILAVAAAAGMAVSLAACGSSSNSPGEGSSSPAKASKGGTLYYYVNAPFDHTDPQRVYLGVELAAFKRTVYRSLVNFPISTDPDVANQPVPDMATDTGTSSDGAKTWSFTLKDGIKWQDGKPVTCEDFKYGVSRVFATDVINGGPNYVLSYLDIPTDKDGLPAYKGPYTKEGQKYFDKAVTCDGKTITYHFKQPWPDFPLAVAALSSTDPYRADKDQGDKSNYQIFSNGPYKLASGTQWDKEHGSTFVRNPNYNPKTDSPKLREANPNKIVWNFGQSTETIYDRLIADAGQDKNAITLQSVPPAYYSQIVGAVAERAVNVQSPFVDYLLPNFKTLKNKKVRAALYYATNVKGYITAQGGPKAASWAHSIVAPDVHGYQPNPAFDAPESGDPQKAKQLLQQSGEQMPYPITYIYPQSDTQDKTAAVLKAGWEKAGFKVTLQPEGDVYYSLIQKPSNDADVMWAGWGADWPSAITVTPPLFDSRPNLSKGTNGQDYGQYKSKEFNSLVDKAQNATSLDVQTKALQEADKVLGQDYAYIPTMNQKFYFVHGSNVTGFTTTPASAQYPDLGPIGVTQ